ncbi:MAG: TonB family protein [Acidobacteriota bacterium]
MRLLVILKIILLIILITLPAPAQVRADGEDEEFLPLSKKHLRGRRIDTSNLKSVTSNEQPVVDLGSLMSEMRRTRSEGPPPSSKSGTSFKETIGSVRIEGRFEVVAAYAPVTDNYLRAIERTIRGNIFPPIIARTLQQSTTVAVTFLVRMDGTIAEIEKESSSGSAALDATAISACRSSSPLPPVPVKSNKSDEVIRLRFVLTFNPPQQ